MRKNKALDGTPVLYLSAPVAQLAEAQFIKLPSGSSNLPRGT